MDTMRVETIMNPIKIRTMEKDLGTVGTLKVMVAPGEGPPI
jgi:hypothetical protein